MIVRPRTKDRNLPPCMYQKHGAYWYVKRGKWTRLGDKLADALTEYARLAAPPGSGMPSLIEDAFREITRTVKPNTARQYRIAADKLKHILAEFSPEQVTPKDVAAIKKAYADKPNACNRMLSFLRSVFSYALEAQLVESNPVVGIKRHTEKKRDRYLTDAELTAIRNEASPALLPIIDVAYYTGQRINDVLSIRMGDISDDGILFKQEKTTKRVLVRMTPELAEAVAQAKALPRPVRGMTLFCTLRGGRKYDYRTVHDMWVAAVEKSGVPDANLHDLRAKALTDAKRQGKNAQALGGHTTEAMTNRYIRSRDVVIAEPPTMNVKKSSA